MNKDKKNQNNKGKVLSHEKSSLYTKDPSRKVKDAFSYSIIGFSTVITVGVLLFIIGFIFVTGAPKINLHFLTSAYDDMIDYIEVIPLKEYETNRLDITLKVVSHDGHHYLAIDELGENSPLNSATTQVVEGEGEEAVLVTEDFKVKENYLIEEVAGISLAEKTIDTIKDEIKELPAYLEQQEIITVARERVSEINKESQLARTTMALADELIQAKSENDINILEVSKVAVIELFNTEGLDFELEVTEDNYDAQLESIIAILAQEKINAEALITRNDKEYSEVMTRKNEAAEEQDNVIEEFYEDNSDRVAQMAYDIINKTKDENLRIKLVQPGGGIVPMLVTTLYMIMLSLIIAGPIGIFAAIYLVEYAKPGPLVRLIRFGTESLAGIPSIIYGLFGALFFVTMLNLGISLLSGALTVSIILLPVIIRQTEESLKAVPMTFREGSLGLGATKIQTIIKVVLPSAVPGILVAIILSVGRVVGESAAILLTAGTTARIPGSFSESGATLTIKAYQVAKEEGNIEMACAIGTVIIVLVVLINLSSKYISTRFMNMNE